MSLSALTERQTTSAAPFTAQAYRPGMASLAAAVNIVTTSLNGTPAGFTATAVCSVSDDPATLLVCLNRQSSVHKAFSQSRYLAAFVQPTLAERAEYPRRALIMALVVLLSTVAWSILALIYYSLRDRK